MTAHAKCAGCGQEFPADQSVCPRCGRSSNNVDTESGEDIAAAHDLLVAEKSRPETVACRSCSAAISTYVDKCPHCGRHTHAHSHLRDRDVGLLRWKLPALLLWLLGAIAIMLLVWSILSSGGSEGS